MSKRIIGVTVGTSMKPEKALVKATDLTEEQKAQVRANIGVVGTGKDGKDGLTPTFEFATMSNGVLDGTQVRILIGGELVNSFFVYNGKTPVRGEDYWTETDKAQIVSDVLSALPTWTGGSY